MATIKINTIGYTINVYAEPICQNLKGQIYSKELFTYPLNYFYDDRGFWVTEIHFLSPNGWTNGYIIEDYDWTGYNAYAYAYGNTGNGDFLIRRSTNLYNGNGAYVGTLNPGDWVMVDQGGITGATHLNWIHITGYSKNGTYVDGVSLYVDTGINQWSMYNSASVYSPRW